MSLTEDQNQQLVLASAKQKEWDNGVWMQELVNLGLYSDTIGSVDWKSKNTSSALSDRGILLEGTWDGTKKALSQAWNKIEDRFGAFFDIANFESSIPQSMSRKGQTAQDLYTWEVNEYPPHLAIVPKSEHYEQYQIFEISRLSDTGAIATAIIPDWNPTSDSFIWSMHNSPQANSIDGIVKRNQELIKGGRDIFIQDNVGVEDNWFTDAVFAQQQLTGTNPTTLTQAPASRVAEFKSAAKAQQLTPVVGLLDWLSPASLYIQDCSYFRDAIGVPQDSPLMTPDKFSQRDRPYQGDRHGCATVSLFVLHPSGQLHPLAIVIDWKESIEKSVTIFNKRLSPADSMATEAQDWPWRYAKTCAQVADWTRHELTIHLTNTHLVEEAVIVAAHRAFTDTTHPVYSLLSAHWTKTLSLNAAARKTLVPSFIIRLIGITDDQTYAFIRDAYKRFQWTDLYVPTDLEKRGFPIDKILTDSKYRNYAYGKNILQMWNVLHTFVKTALSVSFPDDATVANDSQIKQWIYEMQDDSAGRVKSFPNITTVDQLVDAVTMCIHIASPQHTAVNYLQDYYQTFILNKLPAMCTPLPTTLAQLQAFGEQDLMDAIPWKRPQQWLLASHVPHLLSSRVAKEQNLPNYALSLYQLNKGTPIGSAAATLYLELINDLPGKFIANSQGMTEGTIPYDVMMPEYTANSILI